MGGVSAAVSKTAAAPIERVKLLIQNQVSFHCQFGLKVACEMLHSQASHVNLVTHYPSNTI